MIKKLYTFMIIGFLVTACSEAPQPTQNGGTTVKPTAAAEDPLQQDGAQPITDDQPQQQSTDAAPIGQLVVNPRDPNATPGSDYFPPMGTLTGSLSYPSSFIPPMRVVVFTLDNEFVAYTDTAKNQGTYTFDLPAGRYHVVSYPYDPNAIGAGTGGTDTFAGGFTAAVPCGLSVDCTDHTLLEVIVVAGQTVIADPGDWYAPPGTFPSMPNP